ncbi:hypothetical protein CFP56_042712 [Quercus suber]|uniref:RNase H type-1 domain-containing protein n=1 Tax=Quercus suber TaxID=58331 RepID=A0AAW0LJZ3_QUESU
MRFVLEQAYWVYVVSNGCCDECRTCLEDNTHALWYCDVARAIWQTDVRFNFIRTKKLSTFADLVQFLCLHGSSDLFAWFAMVVWSIWERRKRLRVGQPSWQVNEVVQRASELLHEFQDVQTPVRQAAVRSEDLRLFLVVFYMLSVRVNFDAALFENLGCAGIGVAVRDSVGEIIAALSQRIPLPLSVEMAEAMAVRRAVLFVQELCLSKVVVEGDCLRVVAALNSPE